MHARQLGHEILEAIPAAILEGRRLNGGLRLGALKHVEGIETAEDVDHGAAGDAFRRLDEIVLPLRILRYLQVEHDV